MIFILEDHLSITPNVDIFLQLVATNHFYGNGDTNSLSFAVVTSSGLVSEGNYGDEMKSTLQPQQTLSPLETTPNSCGVSANCS